jgi:DNA repair and recombination RAD54-like protein
LLNLPTDLEGCESVLPSDYLATQNKKINPTYSGKFMVLARMLTKIKKETKDKIVLISNYTQTLDIFDTYCKQMQ